MRAGRATLILLIWQGNLDMIWDQGWQANSDLVDRAGQQGFHTCGVRNHRLNKRFTQKVYVLALTLGNVRPQI
jgi:hypothetical protein